MSQTIKIRNFPSLNVIETTELVSDVAVGAGTFTVSNAQGFSADDYFVVGQLGYDTSEQFVVGSIASMVITATSNATIAHDRFLPVTKLFGNKIKVYRAANTDGTAPDDSSFSELTELQIEFDQKETSYTDADGSSNYWYKSTYYNSTSLEETSLADSKAVRGGGYGNYASIESVRTQAGLASNKNITDAQIDEKRQAAQALVNSTLTGKYTVPFSAPINPLIAEITRVLAAGYVLMQVLGNSSTRFYQEGKEMVESITNDGKTGILDKLNAGTLSLLGETGSSEELTSGSAIGFKAWPNSSTATASAENGGGKRMFRVTDRY